MKTLKHITFYVTGQLDKGGNILISYCPEDDEFIATRVRIKRDGHSKPCGIEYTSDTCLHAKTMNELVSYIDYYAKAGEF